MVVAQAEAARDVFGEATEVPPYPLADRLERLEPCGAAIGMDADALGGEMVDSDEYRRLTFAGDRRRQVGTQIVSTVSGMMLPSWLRGRAAPCLSRVRP